MYHTQHVHISIESRTHRHFLNKHETLLLGPCHCLYQGMTKLANMDKVMPPLIAEDNSVELLKFSRQSILLSATTVFECGIAAGMGMNGPMKKKHFAGLASQWVTQTQGCQDPAASEHVHSALWGIVKEQQQVAA
jgi:hypothetical protein